MDNQQDQIAAVRAKMRPGQAERNRRATGTLDKNRDEAVRLMMFLWGFENDLEEGTKNRQRALFKEELLESIELNLSTLPPNATIKRKKQALMGVLRAWYTNSDEAPIFF